MRFKLKVAFPPHSPHASIFFKIRDLFNNKEGCRSNKSLIEGANICVTYDESVFVN